MRRRQVQVEVLQARAREAEQVAEEGSAAREAAKELQKDQAALENGVLQARDLCARREEEARRYKARAEVADCGCCCNYNCYYKPQLRLHACGPRQVVAMSTWWQP